MNYLIKINLIHTSIGKKFWPLIMRNKLEYLNIYSLHILYEDVSIY